MYQIAIVEDKSIIRTGLHAILTQEPQFNIVSQSQSPIDLFQQAWSVTPDLVLMGLIMPKKNTVAAIAQVKKLWYSTKIMVYTYKDAGEGIYDVFQAGADGYLMKDATQEDLIAAIKNLYVGHYYVSDRVLFKNASRYRLAEKMLSVNQLYNILTTRERELLKLIVEGYKNKEIADSLCISLKTVETHRTNLMKKLNVHNVAELISVAEEVDIASHSAKWQLQPDFV
ncbi:LuxR C-terminal-related transcriptional regulator [Methylomicrobium lacus]|uniref:LuxR C-terminal-related transcriptional regulator n=1 Tax=Methylomicrobium lacus TaxID=136992 RepID=UPI0035A8B01F